ncbi:MAG: response regulator [Thermodesulfobacteriota bacterium]
MEKILCVDDDPNLLLLYQEELSEEGYELIIARNSRQALEKFDAESPQLVILDMHMPNMDGLKTLKALLDRNKNLPIILNTAYPVDLKNILSGGIVDWVIKSSDLTELKTKIREIIALIKKK